MTIKGYKEFLWERVYYHTCISWRSGGIATMSQANTVPKLLLSKRKNWKLEPASMSAVFPKKSCGMERKSLKLPPTALTMGFEAQMFSLISQTSSKSWSLHRPCSLILWWKFSKPPWRWLIERCVFTLKLHSQRQWWIDSCQAYHWLRRRSSSIPTIPGLNSVVAQTMSLLGQLPDSVAILGASYIAVELAGVLHRTRSKNGFVCPSWSSLAWFWQLYRWGTCQWNGKRFFAHT